jgi:hypothetical protein
MTERKNETSNFVDRVLRERLDLFNVPVEIRNSIRDEILSLIERPERKPYGACVMTAEASMAADMAKKENRTPDQSAKPRII